jgi:hypothetical protein
VFTVSVTGDELEPPPPENVAVSESEPACKVVNVSVATPEELGVAVPRVVLPFRKVTVPGEPPVGAGVMVSVNVTLCPNVTGFGESSVSPSRMALLNNHRHGGRAHIRARSSGHCEDIAASGCPGRGGRPSRRESGRGSATCDESDRHDKHDV